MDLDSQEFQLKSELHVTMELFEQATQLLSDPNPNPRLLDLRVLMEILYSHAKMLRDKLPKHGSTGQYCMGCRCELCKQAKADYNKMYKKTKAKKK